MAWCCICRESKADHCVLHAPQRLPERGERVPLHTACLDCTTGLANTNMGCPQCRAPLAPQTYGNIHVDNHTCAYALLEQPHDGVFRARFCGRAPGRQDNGEPSDYCHQHGAPATSAEPPAFSVVTDEYQDVLRSVTAGGATTAPTAPPAINKRAAAILVKRLMRQRGIASNDLQAISAITREVVDNMRDVATANQELVSLQDFA